MRSDKKIVIYGLQSTWNYGCEAIVRGTVRMLQENAEVKNLDLILMVESVSLYRKMLQDIPIRIVSLRSKWHPRYLFGAVLRKLGINAAAPSLIPEKEVRSADLALCIGGDVFDEGSHYLRVFTDCAERYQVPVVYWGGSFPAYARTESYSPAYRAHLNGLKAIFVRDSDSQRFLAKEGVSSNVHLMPDPAFAMPSQDYAIPLKKATDELLIGVNVSPYSAYLCSEEYDYRQEIWKNAQLIRRICDECHAKILLVPHVFPVNDPTQNDVEWMTQIVAELPPEYKDKVWQLPARIGASFSKGALKHCDLLISARMHCCVAAVSQNIPTIFLSYSIKAEGMARNVYGNTEWVVPVKNLDIDVVINKIKAMIAAKDSIVRQLQENALIRSSQQQLATVQLIGCTK